MNEDLTDDTVLKMLIERGRASIIKERQQVIHNKKDHDDYVAEDKRIMDEIRRTGTDEG